MSDSDKANQGDSSAVDAEKLLTQARMALKTGVSAYENENYVFAETLFVKALDLFEQANRLEEKDYFQCLHQVADTYFQLGRLYEAKSYYERLSVARLKNPESTDAQVVVALLKLASTYEKLGEAAEALTAFDLIMELAEKTIPTGHALSIAKLLTLVSVKDGKQLSCKSADSLVLPRSMARGGGLTR